MNSGQTGNIFMRYIYEQDGGMRFVQRGHQIYDKEGQFLTHVRIRDSDVYSGTEYIGYILQDVFYPSETFRLSG